MVVTVECDYCGSETETYRSTLERTENQFCDKDCHRMFQRESQSGENNNNWSGGKEVVVCAVCGSDKKVDSHRVEDQQQFFCDHNCFGVWASNEWSGPDNPNFSGGDWEHNYRGENWTDVRNAVRVRDDHTCQNCDRGKKELGQEPDAHHIVSSSEFDSEKESHFMENLVLLCRECHRSFEEMDASTQVERLNMEPDHV